MTTTNLTSDEREQQLKQIRERQAVMRKMSLAYQDALRPLIDDMDYVLSLLDNQTQGVSTDMAVLSGYESGLADAATRMRDKCVEKVKLLAESWARSVEDQWDERPDLSFDAAERLKAAGEIVGALESLTLDQVEQETK